jgi:AraC-like DNA-binding protein
MYYPKYEVRRRARRIVQGIFDVTAHDDPEEHRAQLIGWDRQITLLEPGPLDLRWMQAVLGDVIVAEQWLGRAIADWSSVAVGRLNFVVCLAAPRPPRWCGLEVPPAHAIVGGPGRDFHALMPASFRSLEFIAPAALFWELQRIRGGPGARDFAPRACVIRLHPATEAKVTRLRSALFADPQTSAMAMADPLWVAALRQRTLALLRAMAAQIAGAVCAPPAVRTIPGHGVATRAIQYIDAHAPFLDRVGEVAEAMAVSPRALQQAFRSYAGINPHHYLLARKLHIARRQLRRLPGHRSPVTDAALSAGLTHFGRFSGYYRRLFGEAPRDTLARASAHLAAAAD